MSSAREAMVESLTFADLREGKGSVKQQQAYQEMEWRRCASSPSYFLNTYGWLKGKAGDIERWVLWPTQELLLSEWMEGKSTAAVKARQLGVTTLSIHYFLWKVMFKEAATCHVVSYSEDAAKDAVSRLRITMDRLPDWMVKRAQRGGKDATENESRQDRQSGIKAISFGFSVLKILTSTPNAVAGKAGDFILDEFSRHPDQERVWNNIIPAFDGGGQLIVIANGQGEDRFYHIFQAAKRGDMPMQHHFFSWRDDPNRDDEWYERTKSYFLTENPDSDIYEFKAQYPSTEDEAFYITGNSRFDLSALQGFGLLIRKQPSASTGYLEHDAGGMVWRENGRIGRMRLYERPIEGEQYIMGIDPTGGGASGDYGVIQVCRLIQNNPEELSRLLGLYGYLDPPKLDDTPAFRIDPKMATAVEQVAVYQAKTEPSTLAMQAKRIGEWYNDALAVIELNQHGGTVVDRMKNDYWNLYREVRNEKFSDDESERLGYWQDKHSKMEMIDSLAEWTHSGMVLFRDGATITEMSRYGYDDKGRLTAPKGMNDDLVAGLGLCVVGARSLIVERSLRPSKVFRPWEW